MPKKISNKLYDEIKKYVDDRYEIFKVLQSIEEEMNFEDGDIHDENFIPKFILERIGKVVEDLEEKLENSFSEELISIILNL